MTNDGIVFRSLSNSDSSVGGDVGGLTMVYEKEPKFKIISAGRLLMNAQDANMKLRPSFRRHLMHYSTCLRDY